MLQMQKESNPIITQDLLGPDFLGPLQGVTGHVCCSSSSEWGQEFVAFADFHGLNIPNMALQATNVMSLNTKLGRNVKNRHWSIQDYH